MAEKRMVFAIGRRCGSGGREVGKKLADHYGIKFYDKEIVTMLAERMNMPEDEVAKLEEKVTGHFRTKSGFAAAKDTLMGKMTKSDRMYLTEYALIANLAATENCVIVGRSGNAILADNPHTLHLHILARLCLLSHASSLLADLRAADDAASMHALLKAAEDDFLGHQPLPRA